MSSNTINSSFEPTPAAFPFVGAAWDNLWSLADETRDNLHRQVGALISFANGALQGVTGYATKLNDRCNEIAREGLIAGWRGTRTSSKLLARSRDRSTQFVTSTRDNTRSLVDRASATARGIMSPGKQDEILPSTGLHSLEQQVPEIPVAQIEKQEEAKGKA